MNSGLWPSGKWEITRRRIRDPFTVLLIRAGINRALEGKSRGSASVFSRQRRIAIPARAIGPRMIMTNGKKSPIPFEG